MKNTLRYQFCRVDQYVNTIVIEKKTEISLIQDRTKLQAFETRKGSRIVEHRSIYTCLVLKVGR